MAEGFLEITGVTAPSGAHVGETVNFIVHVKNIGVRDEFKVEISGGLTSLQEFRLDADLAKDVEFIFTMPDYDISIIINTYHWLQDVGWVWDTSSVWELLFPFMNINQ